MMQTEKEYRQREPCPIAIVSNRDLSFSRSIRLPSLSALNMAGVEPLVLEFDPANLDGTARIHEPVWTEEAISPTIRIRGFAADGANGELLLVNINAKTERAIRFLPRQSRQMAPEGKNRISDQGVLSPGCSAGWFGPRNGDWRYRRAGRRMAEAQIRETETRMGLCLPAAVLHVQR